MIRRIFQGLLGLSTTFGSLTVLSVILLYVIALRPLNAQDFTNFSSLPTDYFAVIDLSDAAMCSEGSDYQLYARRGTSDNLIIFFAGGGACWNAETCADPIQLTDLQGYYFPNIIGLLIPFLGGIFQRDNPDNPFADWSAVYIPYCTADFDIGNASPSYTRANGESFTIRHNGRQNVTEALEWIYATFPDPPKLLVAGESAGAFASIFWTPSIAHHYADSRVYGLADGAYLQADWMPILDDAWGANFAATYGFSIADDLTGDAYLAYAATPAKNITWMQINTLYDGTLLFFNSVLSGKPLNEAFREQWSRSMSNSMENVARSGLDYSFYLTDYGLDEGTTPHTSISQPLVYQIEQSGVRLIDWLRRIVTNDERLNVGQELIP